MDLTFSNSELQRVLESRVRVNDRFGRAGGALVQQRVSELLAAETLAVVACLPTFDLRTHDSQGGAFSLQLTPQHRLRFQVAVEPIPRRRGDGQIDLGRIGAIRIVELEER
jgi:hypothetical protein